MLTKRFGLDWMRGGALDFKLLKPVLAGETVTARAVVKAKEPAGNCVRILMDIWCERLEDGAKTSAGVASLLVAP
jgi:acyl dehydratase